MSTKLEKAKVQLLIAQPFFGSLALRHEIKVVPDAPGKTAWVDAQGRIQISEDFMARLSVDEIQFLIAHEVMHVVYAHLARLGKRDPQVWNTACDAVINDLLITEGVGRFIHGGVEMGGASHRTADEIYEELMRKAQKQKSSGGDEDDSEGSGSSKPIGGTGQDIRPEEACGLSSGDAVTQEAQGKLEIAQAMQACKIAGRLSSSLAERLTKLLESPVPWYDKLEKFMCARSEMHRSWQRPNKRFAGRFYLPRRERMPGMGEIVLVIDTSGSLSDTEVSKFMGHVNRIISECRPKKVHLLMVTCRVEYAKTFEQGEEIEWPKESWWGGTDMREGIRWARENAPDAELVITFTDGWTPYPDPEDCPMETVWVITEENTPAPVGETLFI